ncbi:hypothetical protein [Flavobacterium sp. WV_118_3]|jgi:hypothetical protein|uniref:hypothetical protein n=1 Tax=Flavobacterium sp. WV_118_3 TaxID=3151764 RepID=UPI0012C265B2|nr:hypothetical protein [Flavobacterium sp.]HRB72853.1 hypothetical protein [Flavobacterium sp.]
MFKKILLLLLLVSTLTSVAQNSYFVDTKKKKTIVRNDAIDILVIDNRISYKLPGKTWEKYITFKDLDYLVHGPYKFKAFTINNKREGYYIIAEEGSKKLVGISIVREVMSSKGTILTRSVYNYLYVLENDTTVLYDLLVKDSKNKRNREKRTEIPEQIKSYFPNCTPLLNRIDSLLQNSSDPEFLSILELIQNPIYIQCN